MKFTNINNIQEQINWEKHNAHSAQKLKTNKAVTNKRSTEDKSISPRDLEFIVKTYNRFNKYEN